MTIALDVRSRTTLLDVIAQRSVVRDAAAVVAGTALVSIAAQWAIPLLPVPITGQTFAVLFVGATLGAVRSVISMSLYVVLGTLGLPVFAAAGHGSPIGAPSGGFLFGFVLASGLVGWLAQRSWDRKVPTTFLAFAAGTLVIYAFGLPWLYVVLSGWTSETLVSVFGTSNVLAATVQGGLLPFMIGDVFKAILAALLLPGFWALAKRWR
ncbi:MAG: biotin transporter BioY [Pseudolysinimonas sp.]|uniref:biotin transporter BioY n=1 Tax=Pseudolysinimonas sp. TaxID=2680009 RepID=UPI003C76ACCF